MKKTLSSFIFLFLIGCETSTISGPEQGVPVWELPVSVEFDTRLDIDNNGFYHLDMNDDNWQTLHRLSGQVYRDGEPLEGFKVYWASSHFWYLGDTLGYVVNTYLNNEGVYVSVDTSYVIGFEGMEVPTINPASYSNGDGEINTMLAPVRSMVGDTIIVGLAYYGPESLDIDDMPELIEEYFSIVLD